METPVQRSGHIPQPSIVQAKALYVVKGLSPRNIAPKVGLTAKQVQNLVSRYGWTPEREERIKRYEAKSMATTSDENTAFLESMASQSEEIAEDAMRMARREANSRGKFAPKNLQASTQSVKNLVDVYFKARRIDSSSGGNTLNIGSLFVNTSPIPRTETPVIPVLVDPRQVELPSGDG